MIEKVEKLSPAEIQAREFREKLKPYVWMGMFSGEIEYLFQCADISKSVTDGIQAVMTKRRGVDFPILTDEERLDIHRDSPRIEELPKRSEGFEALKNYCEERGLLLPRGRLASKRAMEEFLPESSWKVERKPKEGTRSAIVLDELRRRTSRPEIARMIGAKKPSELSQIIRGLNRLGYENKPTKEQSSKTKKEARARLRVVMEVVGPYLGKGLSAIQIHEALGGDGKHFFLTEVERAIKEKLAEANTSLKQLYLANGRVLPDRAPVELFTDIIYALKALKAENVSGLEKCKIALSKVPADFFGEAGFISAKILTTWADGEDEKGLFQRREGGKIMRVYETINGVDLALSSGILIERLVQKATNKR